MAREGKGKIFINYRRGDDPGFTTALYMHLEDRIGRGRMFMDVESHIRPGEDFAEVLASQVASCEVFLVVIGPRWTELLSLRASDPEDFVTIEIKAAIDQGKRIIPVLVGGAAFPRSEQLPEQIRAITRKHAVTIRPDRFKVDCEGLSAALTSALAEADLQNQHRVDEGKESAYKSTPVIDAEITAVQLDESASSNAPLNASVKAPPHIISAAASKKIARRLIPYLMLCYFIAYLDRVNLGFAALTFKSDLGFSNAVFGLGAGIFFAGYLFFEVPSNIILEKVGARVWIARIMVTWGIISAAMAFVHDETSFYIIRFLLGVAEAGFFPGIILYLTYWYTSTERAGMIGLFMVAVALSGVIGAPLSTLILTELGWRSLFIIEAAPAVILGVITYFYLTDGPAKAQWLTDEERKAVIARFDGERASREAIRKFSLREALLHPRVLGLGLVYFGVVTGLYGLGFWLPLIVKASGVSTSMTGWVVAIPYVFSAIIMVLWTRHSDHTGERVWHVALPAFLGGAGLIADAYLGDPVIAMAALTLGSVGTFAALPTFWTLPTALLTGTAAAGGIALINSIGNIGGFVGPSLVGWIRDYSGNAALATASLGGFMILSGLVTLALGHDSRMESSATAAHTA
jgi:MFS transporter, ACS family, tartrate transporter